MTEIKAKKRKKKRKRKKEDQTISRKEFLKLNYRSFESVCFVV